MAAKDRLIAASPEMLSALANARQYVEASIKANMPLSVYQLNTLTAILTDAITKATGGQS
jgi:hypothetical protein